MVNNNARVRNSRSSISAKRDSRGARSAHGRTGKPPVDNRRIVDLRVPYSQLREFADRAHTSEYTGFAMVLAYNADIVGKVRLKDGLNLILTVISEGKAECYFNTDEAIEFMKKNRLSK